MNEQATHIPPAIDPALRASVVIPALNRAAYLPKALEALRHQTIDNFEVIVVDDGSTDDTLAVLERFKAEHPDLDLRWYAHGTNRGSNHAHNTGIGHARSPFVAIIDSDCIPQPRWLEEVVKVFEADDAVASVTGWVESPPVRTIFELVFKGELKIHGDVEAPRLAGCNMAFRRDVVIDHPLDEDRKYLCDEDGIYLRLRALGHKQRHHPEAVVLHEHPYSSLRKFMAHGREGGRAAAWLVYKYYLPTRLDMAPFLLGYGSLIVVLVLLAFGVLSAWWLVVPAVFLAAACAALIYNEIFRKRKTVWETAKTFPMLLLFYHNKVWGYVEHALRLRLTKNDIERIDLKALRRQAPGRDAHMGEADRGGTVRRVLHVGKFCAPFAGGIETFMLDLMKAQRERGVDVAGIVHHHERGRPTVEESVEGLSMVRVRSMGRLIYAPISPGFGGALRRLCRAFSPDVLHIHMPNVSPYWGLFSPAARRARWVTHWHSDVVSSVHDWRLRAAYQPYRLFERALLRRSDAVIATSPAYLESSRALAPFCEKCHVVPLGVDASRLPDPSEADRAWADAQWPAGALRVLTIGRLTYYKGHRFLVDAIAQTPGVSACFVGRGDLQAAIAQQVEARGVAERVRLAGFVEDGRMRALLAECDVFCLPSIERTEAFGVVLMEAMRYGRPVVAGRIEGSGVGWVVRDGVNGLLVDVADAAALGGALARLRDEGALREQLGRQGAAQFAERFDIARVAGAVERVYAAACDRG